MEQLTHIKNEIIGLQTELEEMKEYNEFLKTKLKQNNISIEDEKIDSSGYDGINKEILIDEKTDTNKKEHSVLFVWMLVCLTSIALLSMVSIYLNYLISNLLVSSLFSLVIIIFVVIMGIRFREYK